LEREFREESTQIQERIAMAKASRSQPGPRPQAVGEPTTVPVERSRRGKKGLLIATAVAAVLMLLAGVLTLRLRTSQGTLELEINEPGAVVKIIDDKDQVEITRKGEKTMTIRVDPGKHRLIVEKAGFAIYTEEFT